jgi:hypothetical protein
MSPRGAELAQLRSPPCAVDDLHDRSTGIESLSRQGNLTME